MLYMTTLKFLKGVIVYAGWVRASLLHKSLCAAHCKRKAQLPVLVDVSRPCQQHLVHNIYLTF